MQSKKYRYIVWFIFITIVLTIGAQFYWNYNNYKINRQRVINEVQISLDNALEEYYATLTKTDYLNFIDDKASAKSLKIDSLFKKNQFLLRGFSRIFPIGKQDSTHRTPSVVISLDGDSIIEDKVFFSKKGKWRRRPIDSLRLRRRISHVFIALMRDSIDFPVLDSLLRNQLSTKNIKLSFVLNHKKNDSVIKSSNTLEYTKNYLHTNSKSTFLKPNERLQLLYKNPTIEILKRSSMGILLSFLLSLTVVSCLFYLLYIIKNQKQLSEIKNDLISNITHEFKTPIATISVVLESLQNFGIIKDPDKTKEYLATSTAQLQKLNTMVEKLLETAALDKSDYTLDKKETDIGKLLNKAIDKYRVLAPEKQFSFTLPKNPILYTIDVFHFENAINNLLDNAVKYGGTNIHIEISNSINELRIQIADDGAMIPKQHQNKIFEKFYRIPTGNIHPVKGFGIGLFYTKSIIEKHGGTLTLENKGKSFNTVFTIRLKK